MFCKDSRNKESWSCFQHGSCAQKCQRICLSCLCLQSLGLHGSPRERRPRVGSHKYVLLALKIWLVSFCAKSCSEPKRGRGTLNFILPHHTAARRLAQVTAAASDSCCPTQIPIVCDHCVRSQTQPNGNPEAFQQNTLLPAREEIRESSRATLPRDGPDSRAVGSCSAPIQPFQPPSVGEQKSWGSSGSGRKVCCQIFCRAVSSREHLSLRALPAHTFSMTGSLAARAWTWRELVQQANAIPLELK